MDDEYKKSILGSILDPTTKTQAAPRMGSETTYDALKKFVLEFANNVSGIAAGPDPTYRGRLVDEDKVGGALGRPHLTTLIFSSSFF